MKTQEQYLKMTMNLNGKTAFRTHALHAGEGEIKLRLFIPDAVLDMGVIHEVSIEHQNGQSRMVKFEKIDIRTESEALANFAAFEKDCAIRGGKISGWQNFSTVFNAMSKNAALNDVFIHAVHYKVLRQYRELQGIPQSNSVKKRLPL